MRRFGMFQRCGFKVNKTLLLGLIAGGFSLSALAAWNGAGTAGGDAAATNINDAANWSDGTVSGDFRPILSNATLRLTADYTFTNGVDLSAGSAVVRHVVVEGTNTLTLGGTSLPGYDPKFNRNLFLPSNANCTVTFDKRLTLNLPGGRTFGGNGTMFLDSWVTGAGGLTFSYTGGSNPFVVLRNDTNTFAGSIYGDGGNLHFTSVADKNKPSALGAGTYVGINNYTVVYIGPRESRSNRDLMLQNSGAHVRNDSACGGLCLTGTVSIGSYVHTDIYLEGISSGESLLSGNIPNYGYDAGLGKEFYTKLDKVHSGTWRLTGKGTYTGWTNNAYHVNLQGGTLIADYVNDAAGAGSNRLFAAGRTLRMGDGRLVVRGKAGAGNTTWQAFSSNFVGDVSYNVLTVDGNGGDGTTVSMGPVEMTGNLGVLLLEKKGVSKVFTPAPVPADSGALRNVNGVLLGNNGARALWVVKDPDGRVGFAGQTADNEIVRYPDTVALTASNSDKTNHFSVSSDVTRTAAFACSTLTFDAWSNPVTLDMGGFAFQNDNSTAGRGVVVSGPYPVTLRGGAHGAQGSTFIYNYGSGKLTWALTNGTCVYVVSGPGLTEFSQPVTASFHVLEGTARLTAARTYAEGTVYLIGNGVLELGADLNGATAGDFTRGLGTGNNQLHMAAGGGFSAYGADRVVNLGGATNLLTWASTGSFVPDGKPLIFSSSHADATLVFENPLALQNRIREIRVQDGAAAVDARLTGKISGYSVAGLVKSGAGTLELAAAQDYRGTVSVIGGGLRLGADDVFAGGTNALVLSGATLDAGTGRNAFGTLDLLADSLLAVGDGSASLAFADCREMKWTGTLAITGKLGPTTLRFGTDGNGLTAAQLATITCRGFSVRLSGQGYLLQNPPGTLIRVM